MSRDSRTMEVAGPDDLAVQPRLPRSLLPVALSAILVAVVLAGTAFLACGADGSGCSSTQKFLDQQQLPLPDWQKVWDDLMDKLHQRRDSHSIWGDIKEDTRTHESMHCGSLQLPVAEKIAAHEWPLEEKAQRTGREIACEKGKADNTYDCEGVNLLSFVPLADFFGSLKANDIWGWVDPENDREYAIMGLGEGTGFVDITAPSSPVIVAIMPTTTTDSTWRDIKVYENRAYVVSEARGHGMQVFDLTRLRGRTNAPTAHDDPDFTFTEFGSAHNIVINTATGRAYGVGAKSLDGRSRKCAGGLVIVDIRQAEPVFEGCFSADGYTHDAECVIYSGPDTDHTGKEICFAYNEDSVTIVDVSRGDDGKFQTPTKISRREYDGSHYTHQGWLDQKHAFIYANDELDEMNTEDKNTRTYIFDVSDLENPVLQSIHRHETQSIDHNNYIRNGFVYQGNYCAGLRILKINDDHSLTEVAYFDTEPQCNVARFEGVWSIYPYFPSGNIVVSSLPKGLFVLRAPDIPFEPEL